MKPKMKIAIIGYGKMGKEIEKQAKLLGVEVSRILDHTDDLSSVNFDANEVAIEFTTPESCLSNINTLIKKNVPVVCGTTGWLDHLEEVEALVKKNKGSFLYASNFSVGVHLFWRALGNLSKQMNPFHQYNVSITETHHVHKKDKPSGTAKTSADVISKNMPRAGKIDIESKREGEVVGYHKVTFKSDSDTIEISHNADTRAIFAKGALECAIWLYGMKGFFTIEDYIQEKYI